MSENKTNEEISHQQSDEAELSRLENQIDDHQNNVIESNSTSKNSKLAWLVTLAAIGLIAVVSIGWITVKKFAGNNEAKIEEKKDDHAENETGKEVKLDQESLNSAGIESEGVTQRPAISKLYVTGTVELNPEKTEMATPLVGGRIENVFYGVGDYVNQGEVLATISSPELAELHGKLNEARTRYELAQKNLERVNRSENRAAILQAKARLDEAEANLQRTKIQAASTVSQVQAKLNEAEATLKRTKKLIELGAGAGKDLIAAQTAYQIEQKNLESAKANKEVISAEAAYKTAKADYDFQLNIPLNKEIQEANSEVKTSQVDYLHIQNQLRTLGISEENLQRDDHTKNASLVAVRAPLSGVITERKFNAGAGIDAATPIFAISNLSTVYVIANVPEASVNKLSVGSIAEIKSNSLGTINGRISYIDPRLDETSRTARVRLEVPNGNGKLRAGMFTEVGFYAGTNEATGQELVVKSEAIQREGEKTIVFIPKKEEAGAFEVREVEIGGEFEGYTAVKSGLKIGELVVTKGSFILKTQLQKGELGEE